MRVKGEITAFLSLIFILLISFIGAISESAALQVSKNEARADMDRAIYSVFGEYRSELLDEYELFAIEGTYETGEFSEEALIQRLDYYGAGNMGQEITGIQFLTDNQGQEFIEQAVRYMRDYSGIELASDLVGSSQKWTEQEISGSESEEAMEKTEEELDTTLAENEVQLPDEENPIRAVTTAKSSPLLTMIMPKEKSISTKAVSLSDMPSHRAINHGRGTFQAADDVDGAVSNLLFREYLMQKFSHAAEENIDGALSYELEYLIAGKESDSENLEEVAKKLLLMRMGANFLYLQTDTEKVAEAEAMAAGMATVVALPVLTEPLKQAILAAWAYGESIMDLRSLLQGKKVPLVKTKESWQMGLTSLVKLGTEEDTLEGKDTEGGLKYQDYLRILLFLENQNQSSMRALDLIEHNMRQSKGLTYFRVDYCVTKLKTKSQVSLQRGITYEFPTYFGYR